MKGFANKQLDLSWVNRRTEQLHQDLLNTQLIRKQVQELLQKRGNAKVLKKSLKAVEEQLELIHWLISGYSQISVLIELDAEAAIPAVTSWEPLAIQSWGIPELQQLQSFEQRREELEDTLKLVLTAIEKEQTLLTTAGQSPQAPPCKGGVPMTKISNESKAIAAAKIEWFRAQLQSWAEQNRRDFPWRDTNDPYAILVAESLLQKSQATTIVPVYQAFLAKYPNIETLAVASVEEVAKSLKSLGLFFRAARLCQAAKIVVEEFGGKIPNSETELLKLPGIGKYTARAICSQAFGQSLAVLDTNVARILERFFGLKGGRVKSRCPVLWQAAEQVAPNREVGRWNLTLLDFGAAVCTAKNPNCSQCPLQKECCYFRLMR